ncbi:MAG: dihydrodipicolinate synthase family protein, partial [Alphaproteobacteria bacterium]|nr:dihydrodipicolinate synthase family protein [Alphaproteobacteria bacterium]
RADGGPDLDRLVRHAQWLLANGCDGVAPLGTTGEGNSLPMEARLQVPGALKRAGIPGERAIIGTGACSLGDAILLTQRCVEAGYPNVLVLPPFYYKNPAEDGLFAYFAGIAKAVAAPELRLFLYHFPQMAAVPITQGLVGRLRDAFGARIAGMKDSSGDWANTEAMIKAFPGFRCFSGSEELLTRNLAAGGAGCISASTNVTARLAAAMLKADPKADPAGRAALDAELKEIRQTIQKYPLVAALKQIMAWHTGDASWLSLFPPLVPLSRDAAAELRGKLEAFRYFRQDMPFRKAAA